MVNYITSFYSDSKQIVEDIKLLIDSPRDLSDSQKSDLEKSVMLRVAGIAYAIFSAAAIFTGLCALPLAFTDGYITIVAGGIVGMLSHDLICWGKNWRGIILKTDDSLNIFGGLANLANWSTSVLFETLTGFPYELHDTWLLKHAWKWYKSL